MNRLVSSLVMLVMLIGVLIPAAGAETLSEAEKKEFAQNLALPSPAEMFLAINRLNDADWSKVAGSSPRYDYGDNYVRALNLGLRATDGLVAILSKDKAKLGEVIVVVITLAEDLMVQDTILDRSSTFEQLANEGRWSELRDELDSLRYLIEMEMDQIGDQDIATLVRVGGWLKGLTATAGLMKKQHYSDNVTSILYQPNLVDYFTVELANMEPEAKANPLAQALMKALPKIRALVNVGYGKPVPDKNIEELHRLGSALVAKIEEG
ncbi:MAG: hypothetical protein KKC99_10230 [Proteobacteria bacterium]|nr:hypothetical protein [Pseudomonadota bacterium]